MKLYPLILAVAVLLAASPTRNVSAADYVLDDQHTSVVFTTSHFGFSYTYGMFGKYTGQFSVDMQNPTQANFQFTIDAASLDTKSEKRDQHLRGPDFFNVKQFPEITFVSRSVEASADGKTLNITGDLTLHGQTKSIVLPLTYLGAGKGPYGNDRIGFMGRTKVKRSDFGMGAMAPQIGDDVTLLISFEGLQQ
ncbi:YceI family protein [Novipirellula sp. SH528]|uniref:YceI family protein n=1 Tax=Novipirellula sp. SH528 TaxID=3454466 RepID=UPI003F9FEFFD